MGYFERRTSVKFVFDASTGKLVMPVETGFAHAGSGEAVEMVLFAPAEQDWDIHVSLAPSVIPRPESEECVDRWGAYHGSTSNTAWVRCSVTAGKSESGVFDQEHLEVPNPLGRAEYALIRRANTDPRALSAACKSFAGTLVADPLCVGVDPLGVDVRARFGIVRIEFPVGIHASTPDAAQAQIDRLLLTRAP